MRGKDGEYCWFLSRALPIRNDAGEIIRWFGTNTDVTEQRILAEAAQVLSSSLDYDDVLAHVARLAVPALADACAIDVVDDHGALRRIASAGTDQHPLDADCDRAVADAIASGEPVLLPSREEPSCAVVPLVARGRVQGAITLQLGAPRRYRQADVDVAIELGRRAGHALDNARLYRQAQDASKLRDEVLAIVSHDLRTPLSSIDLSTTMLLDRHGDDLRSRKQLGLVRRSIDRMNHLIRDLLDMASIEAGKLSLELRREDVQPMLDEIIDLHEPLAADKGIRIMRSYEVDGVHVTCDRERIAQVLGNLLGNAKKYCSSGDVIMVSARRTGADLLIVVEDSGPGIAPGDLPHVFELFWSSSAHPQHGAGLGLYISMGLVQAHGGRISAESAPGRGARFTVTLPIAES
jgi:signal transduction histidine kinase